MFFRRETVTAVHCGYKYFLLSEAQSRRSEDILLARPPGAYGNIKSSLVDSNLLEYRILFLFFGASLSIIWSRILVTL